MWRLEYVRSFCPSFSSSLFCERPIRETGIRCVVTINDEAFCLPITHHYNHLVQTRDNCSSPSFPSSIQLSVGGNDFGATASRVDGSWHKEQPKKCWESVYKTDWPRNLQTFRSQFYLSSTSSASVFQSRLHSLKFAFVPINWEKSTAANL